MFEADSIWEDTSKEVTLSEALFGEIEVDFTTLPKVDGHSAPVKTKQKRKRKCKNKYKDKIELKKAKLTNGTEESTESSHSTLESETCDTEGFDRNEGSRPSIANKKLTEVAKIDENSKTPNAKVAKIVKQKVSNTAPTPQKTTENKSNDTSALANQLTVKLQSSRFRYINEQMYNKTSYEAMDIFDADPESFDIYHKGFLAQVAKWPVKPLDLIIKWIKARTAKLIISDFGCGEAFLAQNVKNKVHSFDLVAMNKHVTAADISKVPLESESVDVVVFCLALMGVNMHEFLIEANRVLKEGGILKIAEVASRFGGMHNFISDLKKLGFHIIKKDTSQTHFYMFDFRKVKNLKKDSLPSVFPGLKLKPCLYKKR